ncbi:MULTISPECIES: YlxR family protein [unclassified Microbacterium]|uniref:YlxR family protein n=1 Tax=unclassified Microbacterium TaxID=2609290 RepID=UPI00214B23B1|nr:MULTISPECIES: YlxR family protein [unclassified Microbacterium]MCR2801550.1 YlxR family protein [Microbacterium sp. zg.Y818]MCR2827876.1 YlxR family protein [Microbacterium sp. zg.Y909]WIM23172.1 YlxR family protein [Microbacterium sp. zg-Y818]
MDSVRTCVGCRARALRTTLTRVVAVDLQVVVDERGSMPGRGAWVHPTSECVDAAIRRRAFGRALRVSGSLDTQTLQNHFQRNG